MQKERSSKNTNKAGGSFSENRGRVKRKNKIERDSGEGVEKIAFQNYWPTPNNLYPHAVLGSSWSLQSLQREREREVEESKGKL